MKKKNKDIIEENIETDKNIKQYNKAKEIKKKQIKEYFDNRKPK